MDKQERKVVEASLMELSDLIERLTALHEYVTESLFLEKEIDVKNPNHTYVRGG